MTLSARQVDEIRNLAEAGKTTREIAAATGRRETGVYALCQKYGIQIRTKTGQLRGVAKWSPERRAAFEAMRADPERWDRYTRALQKASGLGGADVSPRPCAPGAWNEALRGRRFTNVPRIVRLHELGGQMPSREVATGQSSMAYL